MRPELTKSELDIKDKFRHFKLSDMFNATTRENQYLCYLVNEYSKHIVGTYISLFMGRDGSIDVILDIRFSEAKEQADIVMNDIGEFVNTLDINSLNKDDLSTLSQKINDGISYMNHLKESLSHKVE